MLWQREEVVNFHERNLEFSVVSSIAHCYLDVGPAGKRGGSTAGSAKIGFSSQRDKENAPLPFGGRAMGRSSFRLFIFQMSDHSCVARCALSHDHVNFSVEGKIDVYARTELDEPQVVV